MTDRLALHPPTRCSTLTAHHLKAIPTTAYSLTAAHLKAIPMAAYSVTTAHLRENQMTGRLVWADRLMEKQTMDYFFQPHLLDLQRWLPRCATPRTDWMLSQMWPTGQSEARPTRWG